MLTIILWALLYDIVVAASIYFLGNPNTVLGQLTPRSLFFLLFDWSFLLGGLLALGARFIFVIINNLASKQPELAGAHLSITTIVAASSIIFVVVANHFLLHEQLSLVQMIGGAIIIFGLFLILR